MPIYEYACGCCGHEFELFVRSLTARDGSACPHCQSEEIDKRFSTFAATTRANGGPAMSCGVPGAPCSGPV